MTVPSPFYVPWIEFDPSGSHGGIEGELGDFVAPRLGDNTRTKNQDVRRAFRRVIDSAASISMNPDGEAEDLITRNAIEEILRAYNWCAEAILDRTSSVANKFFQWTHAQPSDDPFLIRPVKYPLRNPLVTEAVYFLLGTSVELAECNCNATHSKFTPQISAQCLSPLHHMKANIIRDYFDLEVAGEISIEELEEISVGSEAIVDSGKDAERPTAEAVASVLTGVEVLTWFPSDQDWAKFGEKEARRFSPQRILQPEGSSETTEDVAPQDPVAAG